jgi:hypothetical protein
VNPLQQLQSDVVAYLLGNPATAAVPYRAFRSMAIESAVKAALAGWSVRVPGKTGVSCLALMPSVFAEYPDVPGPQAAVEIVIRTFEDPKVNNSGLSAEDVALANLAWLDGLIIEDLTQLYPGQMGPVLKANHDFPGFLVYDTVMAGQLPQDALGRTFEPTIGDDDAGNVTLGCADTAAAIYYTTDGSCPIPGFNAASPAFPAGSTTRTYSGPFAVAPGTTVRFIAWNPALLPSHVNQAAVDVP